MLVNLSVMVGGMCGPYWVLSMHYDRYSNICPTHLVIGVKGDAGFPDIAVGGEKGVVFDMFWTCNSVRLWELYEQGIVLSSP